MYEDVSYNIY